MHELNGVLHGLRDSSARVVCVRGRDVIAEEIVTGPDAPFSLQPPETPEWLVFLTEAPRLSAVAARPEPDMRPRLPGSVEVTFQVENPPRDAMLWLDPLRLTGFPPDLLWALRGHADRSIDLHVLDAPLASPATELHLQAGTYRVSGGTVGMRPWEHAAALSGMTNVATGSVIDVTDGAAVVQISADSRFQLTFRTNGPA